MEKKPQIFLESHNINNMFTGFGQFNYWLIKSLLARNSGFDFTVYGSKRSSFQEFGEKVNFRKYYSFHRKPLFRIRKKYDLWHSLNQNTKIEPYHSLPYVTTFHDAIFLEKGGDLSAHKKNIDLIKEKIRRSDVITFISEYARKSANQYFDIPQSLPQPVIYNGNPVSPREPVNLSSKAIPARPFLFSLGQFRDNKNFHSLVEMLAEMKDHHLIIAGDNDKAYGEVVKAAIVKHRLQDRVWLPGKISETEKHFYLQNCEAFVFPSLFEGFGLPPIEAMAYGKPVFLARRTSLPEIGGEVAFYWDDFEPQTMKHKFEQGMHTFYENRSRYEQQLKERAARFSWDKAASDYLEVYKAII